MIKFCIIVKWPVNIDIDLKKIGRTHAKELIVYRCEYSDYRECAFKKIFL